MSTSSREGIFIPARERPGRLALDVTTRSLILTSPLEDTRQAQESLLRDIERRDFDPAHLEVIRASGEVVLDEDGGVVVRFGDAE